MLQRSDSGGLFGDEMGKGGHQGCQSVVAFAAFTGDEGVLDEFGELAVAGALLEAFQLLVNLGESFGGGAGTASLEFVGGIDERGEVALEGGERDDHLAPVLLFLFFCWFFSSVISYRQETESFEELSHATEIFGQRVQLIDVIRGGIARETDEAEVAF